MERFFRSLKTEWVPEHGYTSFAHTKQSITSHITGHYSQTKPHQHNDGATPTKAEEIYWSSSKSATSFTLPLQQMLLTIIMRNNYFSPGGSWEIAII